jgi:hypothetical protein
MNVRMHPKAIVFQVLLVGPRVAQAVMTERNVTVPVDNLITVVQPAANYYTGSIPSSGKMLASSPSAQTDPETHIASYTMDTTRSFLADKAAGA